MTLTRAAHAELQKGGVLEHLAEQLYGGLDGARRAAVRCISLELVELESNDRPARRAVAKQELVGRAGGDLQLVEGLLGRRLVDSSGVEVPCPRLLGPRRGGDELEVLHESILTGWKRLDGWIRDAHDDLRKRRELEAVAAAWWPVGGPVRRFLSVDAGWQYSRFRDLDPTERRARAWLRVARRKRRAYQLMAVAAVVVLVLYAFRFQAVSQNRRLDDRVRGLAQLAYEPRARLLATAWSLPDPVEALDRVDADLEWVGSNLARLEARRNALEQALRERFTFELDRRREDYRTVLAQWKAVEEVLDEERDALREIAQRLAGDLAARRGEWEHAWPLVEDSPYYEGLARSPRLLPVQADRPPGLEPRWYFLLLGTGTPPTYDARRESEAVAGPFEGWIVGPKSGILLCYVPAGEFAMGSIASDAHEAESAADEDDERRLRRVELSPYFIAVTETTNAQAERLGLRVLRVSPGEWDWPLPDQPATQLEWTEAEALSRCQGGALPTEAQWERAVRADAEPRTEWVHGDEVEGLEEHAVFRRDWEDGPERVASRRPNAWLLHDMAGNAAEWCADWYGPYDGKHSRDPTGPEGDVWGVGRVVRGGAFRFDAEYCRSAYRVSRSPRFRNVNQGFRVALPAVD